MVCILRLVYCCLTLPVIRGGIKSILKTHRRKQCSRTISWDKVVSSLSSNEEKKKKKITIQCWEEFQSSVSAAEKNYHVKTLFFLLNCREFFCSARRDECEKQLNSWVAQRGSSAPGTTGVEKLKDAKKKSTVLNQWAHRWVTSGEKKI